MGWGGRPSSGQRRRSATKLRPLTSCAHTETSPSPEFEVTGKQVFVNCTQMFISIFDLLIRNSYSSTWPLRHIPQFPATSCDSLTASSIRTSPPHRHPFLLACLVRSCRLRTWATCLPPSQKTRRRPAALSDLPSAAGLLLPRDSHLLGTPQRVDFQKATSCGDCAVELCCSATQEGKTKDHYSCICLAGSPSACSIGPSANQGGSRREWWRWSR